VPVLGWAVAGVGVVSKDLLVLFFFLMSRISGSRRLRRLVTFHTGRWKRGGWGGWEMKVEVLWNFTITELTIANT